MSRLVWGEPGKRFYETGIDRGVFYPVGGIGVPWNGLTAVTEAPSGGEITQNYVDGEQYRQQRASESFSAKIQAFTYPREFEEYDGMDPSGRAQVRRKMFNLSYRTTVGNDFNPSNHHLIHLVYNAVVSPTTRGLASLGANNQATPFEWQLDTVPEILPTGEISAHLIINTDVAYPWAVSMFEDVIYGSVNNEPRFPSISEVLEIFENASILRITDHGDGTWTAEGPDDVVMLLNDTTFLINWPSAVYIDENTYTVRSL